LQEVVTRGKKKDKIVRITIKATKKAYFKQSDEFLGPFDRHFLVNLDLRTEENQINFTISEFSETKLYYSNSN